MALNSIESSPTLTEADDKTADYVAEHVAITIAMNIPSGLNPESFFDFVIDKVRAKKDAKIKQHTRRRMG